MGHAKLLPIGGYVSGGVLIVFGVIVIALGAWGFETALTTALDMGFMSGMLSVFSIVVGVALLLTGIGLVILAIAVFGRPRPAESTAPTPAPAAV